MPPNPITERAKANNATAVPTPIDSEVQTTSKLQAVESALAKSQARAVTNTATMEEGLKKTQTATDVITSAIDDATSATQIIEAAKGNANLQAQNATIDVISKSASPDIQAILMTTLQEDEARLADLLNKQTDITKDRMLNSRGEPMRPSTRFEFRRNKADIDNARAQLNQTSNQIERVTGATEAFAKINALSRKTLNEGVIEANYKAIAAEGKIKGAEAEIRNVATNASALSRLAAADAREVAASLEVFRLEGEAASREIAIERQQLQREQFKITREKMKLQLPAAKVALESAELKLKEAKALSPSRQLAAETQFNAATKAVVDQLETEAQIVEAVQKGQSASGVPIESRELILHGSDQPGAIGAKYNRLQEIGGSPDHKLGNTPFEAKESLALISPTGNFEGTPITAVLDQITTAQIAAYQATGKPPKDVTTLRKDFNTTAAAFMKFRSDNIKTGDDSNPYHAPPMSVLEGSKAIQEDTLFNRVLKPMQMKELNPQTILDAAVAGIRAGTVSPEEAAKGIELIFDVAADFNNKVSGGFRRVGLPNQTTYNTSITLPPTAFQNLKSFGKTVSTTAILPVIAASTGFDSKESKEIANRLIGTQLSVTSVDLMDRTKVQELIVKLLSANPPPKTVEAAPPTTSPASTTTPTP